MSKYYRKSTDVAETLVKTLMFGDIKQFVSELLLVSISYTRHSMTNRLILEEEICKQLDLAKIKIVEIKFEE